MAKKQADAEVWAVVADKEDYIRMYAFKVIVNEHAHNSSKNLGDSGDDAEVGKR